MQDNQTFFDILETHYISFLKYERFLTVPHIYLNVFLLKPQKVELLKYPQLPHDYVLRDLRKYTLFDNLNIKLFSYLDFIIGNPAYFLKYPVLYKKIGQSYWIFQNLRAYNYIDKHYISIN